MAFLAPAFLWSQSAPHKIKPIRQGTPVANKTQAYYSFSHSTGTYTYLNEPNSLNTGAVWDDPEYHLYIGFSFTFFDQTWDTVYVVDYLAFEPNYYYWIDAVYSDWIDRGYDSVSQSNIGWVLEGAAPNRILKIEWRNAGFYCEYDQLTSTPDSISVQAWLYETSNKIEIHVGPGSADQYPMLYCAESGPQCGVWHDDGTVHESLYLDGDPTAPVAVADDAAYATYLDTLAPSGMIYTFTFTAPVQTTPALERHFSLSPNPATQQSLVSLPNEAGGLLRITDLSGKVMSEAELLPGGDEYAMPLDQLPAGVYLVHLHQGGRMHSQRLIKQ